SGQLPVSHLLATPFASDFRTLLCPKFLGRPRAAWCAGNHSRTRDAAKFAGLRRHAIFTGQRRVETHGVHRSHGRAQPLGDPDMILLRKPFVFASAAALTVLLSASLVWPVVAQDAQPAPTQPAAAQPAAGPIKAAAQDRWRTLFVGGER